MAAGASHGFRYGPREKGALQTSLDIEGGSRSCEGELFNSNGHAIVAYSQFLVYTQLLSVIVHFICQLRLT